MIRNWEFHRLDMDFSNLCINGAKPSDIDGYYIHPNGFLLLIEIKYILGELRQPQRGLLQSIVDSHKEGGAVVFVTHTECVQHGDTAVDVAKCEVKEYYWHGRWMRPRKTVLLKEIFERVVKEGSLCERDNVDKTVDTVAGQQEDKADTHSA